MKNLITILFTFICLSASAQTNTFPSSGNVGIGASSLTEMLTIGEYGGSITLRDRTTIASGVSRGAYLNFDDYAGSGARISLEHNYYFGAAPRALIFSVSGWDQMRITSAGWVGIGTASPAAKLHVSSGTVIIDAPTSGQFLAVNNSVWGNAGSFETTASGDIHLKAYSSNFATDQLFLKNGGNVGIGTTNPAEKLAVNGNIRAKEIKVETTGWPDYIFSEDYELMPLRTVAEFIKTNKHLPEIPAAAVVEKEGIELGDMNARLLKKIEELTLHAIEQEKRIEKLEQLMKSK